MLAQRSHPISSSPSTMPAATGRRISSATSSRRSRPSFWRGRGERGGFALGMTTALAERANWVWLMDDVVAPDASCLGELLDIVIATGSSASPHRSIHRSRARSSTVGDRGRRPAECRTSSSAVRTSCYGVGSNRRCGPLSCAWPPRDRTAAAPRAGGCGHDGPDRPAPAGHWPRQRRSFSGSHDESSTDGFATMAGTTSRGSSATTSILIE